MTEESNSSNILTKNDNNWNSILINCENLLFIIQYIFGNRLFY